MNKKIIGITVGIRFARSFRIPDISGRIIDNILYGDKTPFGTDFFPKVQENSNREKTLYNPETSEYLRINTDDLILGITVNDDFDKKFDWIKNDVLKYFQDVLFREYEIRNIKRLGIIFSHKILKNQKLDEAVSLITDNSIENTDNISISFSKKLSTVEALYRKNVNDYRNTIYNFDEMKEAVYSTLDYQYYYDPIVEDLRNCFIEKILDDAKKFLKNDFHNWLIKYEKKKSK